MEHNTDINELLWLYLDILKKGEKMSKIIWEEVDGGLLGKTSDKLLSYIIKDGVWQHLYVIDLHRMSIKFITDCNDDNQAKEIAEQHLAKIKEGG